MDLESENLAQFVAATDIGRLRTNNEDAVRIEPAQGVAVLADGMGGHNAGEVASALAIEVVGDELLRWLEQRGSAASARELRQAMEEAVASANRAIYQAAHTHDAYAGMGTTLVVSLLVRKTLWVGHIGDSRAYRYRAGRLQQLTKDHSLLQEHIDMGLLSAHDVTMAAHRNLVTRALGVVESVDLDLQAHTVQPGDVYLLCSDGLSDLVSEPEVVAVLGDGSPLASQLQALIGLANARGGRDNISVVLCQVPMSAKKPGLFEKLLEK